MGEPRRIGRAASYALLLLPALAALLAYFDTYDFEFIFDDRSAIVGNEALRRGDWWSAAFGTYQSLSNRPLACLSLAFDLDSGLSPGGMHLVSLTIHAVNAVLVGLIARSVLPGNQSVAAMAATIWAVHPLGVDAVAYLTQRSMLLMGLFALTATLAVLRAHGSPHRGRWQVVAVAATVLMMASKEEGIALPILLVLVDRAFCASSWAELRSRRAFYLALASSWLVLAFCVGIGPHNPTVGYATTPRANAWESLLTQTQCLSHYVRSVFAPNDLRGAYDFAVLREVGPALIPGLLLVIAAIATVAVFPRRPRPGLLGAWFFLLLAPTSSVMPIITELCADRRMYLPLLAFVMGFMAIVTRIAGPRAAIGLAVVVAAGLLWQTRGLTPVYRDDAAFATHAAATNELLNGSFLSGRILSGHAHVLYAQGRVEEAQQLCERSMQCEFPDRKARLLFANLLLGKGRTAQAERELRGLVSAYPDFPGPMSNLAYILNARAQQGAANAAELLAEAEQLVRRAVALAPRQPEFLNMLGSLLCTQGRPGDAIPFLERALAAQPEFVDARLNLGVAYLQLRRPREALSTLDPLTRASVTDPRLGQAIAEARRQLANANSGR